MSKPRCHNETVCQRPTLPSTNSHSPVAYLSASPIFSSQIILFHSFVVFCLFFPSQWCQWRRRQETCAERDGKQRGPHQPESERGCCSHMVYFLTTRPPGCLLNPAVRISTASCAPYKTFETRKPTTTRLQQQQQQCPGPEGSSQPLV